MSMFDKLPRKVALAIMLVKALNVKESIRLVQDILYLWREFLIKIDITPVIQEFKVSFYYKDERISGIKIKDLREIVRLIRDLEKTRIDKE